MIAKASMNKTIRASCRECPDGQPSFEIVAREISSQASFGIEKLVFEVVRIVEGDLVSVGEILEGARTASVGWIRTDSGTVWVDILSTDMSIMQDLLDAREPDPLSRSIDAKPRILSPFCAAINIGGI